MGTRRPAACRPAALAFAVACLGLGAALPALGHIILGDRTLQLLVADADLVARARISDVRANPAVSDAMGQRPTVGALLTEVLKGDLAPGKIRFAQHGHGVAAYEPGEDVLLFLHRIERSDELDELSATGLAWVSIQEHDEKVVVPPGEDPVVVAVVRAYAQAERIPDPAGRIEALRRVTLTMLGSGDPRLASDAIQGLAMAGEVPLITEDDLPMLMLLVDDASLPIGIRVGLLVELERRALVVDRSRWVMLLATTSGADRRAVIRAAGRHPSPEVNAALLALLEAGDVVAAREAAIALGWPGNRAAVQPLSAALEQEDAGLRMAAIRGLGGIGTPDAQQALEASALSHSDPQTRRRAGAEATRLARRGPTKPPTRSAEPAPENHLPAGDGG